MTSNECCMHLSTFHTMSSGCSRSFWEICQGHRAEHTVQNDGLLTVVNRHLFQLADYVQRTSRPAYMKITYMLRFKR